MNDSDNPTNTEKRITPTRPRRGVTDRSIDQAACCAGPPRSQRAPGCGLRGVAAKISSGKAVCLPPPRRIQYARKRGGAASDPSAHSNMLPTSLRTQIGSYFGRDALSREEDYGFDVAGYLNVPGALGANEVQSLSDAMDAAVHSETSPLLQSSVRDLLVNTTAVWYLNKLVGAGYRLDTEPELLPQLSHVEEAPLLGGGAMPRRPKDAFYYSRLGKRQCNSVRVVFALDDVQEGDGGMVLIPCSHTVNVEAPDRVLRGDPLTHCGNGILFNPPQKAGDMLVIAGACIQGLQPWRGAKPQRLLSLRFVGRSIVSEMGPNSLPDPNAGKAWWEALTDAQRVSLGRPVPYSPTILTTPSKPGGSQPSAVSLDPTGTVVHPSIYKRDPDSEIDELEFFHWELCGYLVLRGVMDPEWLAAANAAVDANEHLIKPSGTPLGQSGGVAAARNDEWAGRPTLGGLLQLPDEQAEPFRRMVAHPEVQHRLNWMGGSGLRGGTGSVFATVEGGSGHSLHDGAGGWPHMGYEYTADGRSYASAITVTWQLRDVPADMGGFACVPGSHHAHKSHPACVRNVEEHMNLVVQPVMKAGDVIFFIDGGLTHGATAWKNPLPRRGVLMKYRYVATGA